MITKTLEQARNPRDVTSDKLVVDIRKHRDAQTMQDRVDRLKSLVDEAQRDGWLSEIDRSITELVAIPSISEQKLKHDKCVFKWKAALVIHLELAVIGLVVALKLGLISWFN